MKDLEEIVLNLYETFVFINDDTESAPEYLEEAEVILLRIQEAHKRYLRRRRSADNSESETEIYRDMASTIEKLLMQSTHTRSEVMDYQNKLISKLEQEKTDEVIYKDQRFVELNNNIRENFKSMIDTVKEEIIEPICPNYFQELEIIKYLLIASVTLNVVLIAFCVSRYITSKDDKGLSTATTASALL